MEPGVVSPQHSGEAEAGEFQVQDQLGLHIETLSQKNIYGIIFTIYSYLIVVNSNPRYSMVSFLKNMKVDIHVLQKVLRVIQQDLRTVI
jgi:hypothetical protein